jgi:hypothetical protein
MVIDMASHSSGESRAAHCRVPVGESCFWDFDLRKCQSKQFPKSRDFEIYVVPNIFSQLFLDQFLLSLAQTRGVWLQREEYVLG